MSAETNGQVSSPVTTCCPFCGQPLQDQAAIENLARKQARFESRLRRELEEDYDEKAQQAAKDKAEELTEAKRQLELEYAKKDKAIQATVKKLEEHNGELARRVERLSAGERGEFNEDDICAQLQRAFPQDVITKTRRGQRGADIFHEVLRPTQDGPASAGMIVYECKDTLHWNNAFIDQAKAAAKEHRTPFVVLVTQAFPPNIKTLFVKDDVIVVDAARCVVLAGIVRRMVVEIRHSRLLAGSQAEKTAALYEYVSGTEFRQAFESLASETDSLTDLLAKERRSHELTWAKREVFYRDIGDGLSKIGSQFEAILQKTSFGEGR